ncbi:TIGR03960 family B12-binding radical SAM protein [Desulfovibrio sp. OttesenSCG-928-G15]|nr:TIGR03960 family B12-binding radical SAM protein [Desulfovibrio sp. OttesenSCG-928-G15]
MRELLPLLPKPSRYIGIEEGSVHKNACTVRLRVALAFPDMYEVGMSYLGQKILYSIINAHEGWQAERVFTPCRDAARILKERGAPLCSLESDTPLARTDVIGFSVTHELCYTNILLMLDLAGIPFHAATRAAVAPKNGPWPLIIAGGGCTLAAEPIAPFMDVMVLGEGETVFPALLETLEQCRADGLSRKDTLLALGALSGVYIPEFFAPDANGLPGPLYASHALPTRRVSPDMDDAPYPVNQPIPFGAVHNRLALEIGRGCTRGCRFCQAGNVYRPARERSVPCLQSLLDKCLAGTGFDDVSFLSLSTGDYSALKELFMSTVDRCAQEQISVSLPSLRVGSIDDAIMERMAGIRRTGATLAPEAGSQRLRDVINKGVTEEGLILHVQKLFEHGWQQIKLYFMIGLPTETDADLDAIVDLCRKARDAAGPGIKRLQITAGISPFVPKPFTPFQWEAQISLAEIRRRIDYLLTAFKQEKRIKMRWHEPDMSFLEGIFSRADRRLSPVVESAYAKGGIFASWMEGFSLAPWLEAMAEHGLDPENYTRERSLDEPLPWEHLNSGISKEFLLRERKRAIEGKTTEDCRYSGCKECGVCDSKASPSLLDSGVYTASSGRAAQRGPSGPPDAPAPAPVSYGNRLNNPQRDQEAHSVSLDQYGRVIVRGETPQQTKTGKSKPPALAPHLTVKAEQLRFHYARLGNAAYLSQLEIQHVFDRALRRAGVPLAFSQGFHPLPLVSFGRALPVGVASEDEWFSVYLREHCDLARSVDAMNRSLPKGLKIIEAERLSLQKSNADAIDEPYELEYLGPEENLAPFHAAWETVRQSAGLTWEREGKKGTRTLDARAYFTEISPLPGRLCRFMLNWANGYVSPLALCLFALESAGFDTDQAALRLTRKKHTG